MSKIPLKLFDDQLAVLDKLTNEQAGQFIKAIYIYKTTGEKPDSCEFWLEILLTQLFSYIDRSNEESLSKSEKNRQAGIISAEKRANDKTIREELQRQQTSTLVNENKQTSTDVNTENECQPKYKSEIVNTKYESEIKKENFELKIETKTTEKLSLLTLPKEVFEMRVEDLIQSGYTVAKIAQENNIIDQEELNLIKQVNNRLKAKDENKPMYSDAKFGTPTKIEHKSISEPIFTNKELHSYWMQWFNVVKERKPYLSSFEEENDIKALQDYVKGKVKTQEAFNREFIRIIQWNVKNRTMNLKLDIDGLTSKIK